MSAPVVIDAGPGHAKQIAAIYNQALKARTATFKTRPRAPHEVAAWLGGQVGLKLVMVGSSVAGFARISDYRDRACYAGIKEYSVDTDAAYQRHGQLDGVWKDCVIFELCI